jgi:hypothetical protein
MCTYRLVSENYSMLYRAITRPSRLAAPARLMATLPVAMGAPPVELADTAVAEEPDEVDAAVVWTAAEPVEPEPVEADSEPALA